ncbi:hypothetical protein JOF56_002867 [Kibdelosporangium banguiense]|uniref:DUF2567 domain-containing protein n=1 Tax=Kibdelosporangium banguiense TaxID=1365924 RepID=A0ABS4TDI0_9PSEU|nr:hypothetical protein [Kibdelosporangium banguiense]MBP2322482.1 hypothetical protein [Kibdelosporangium banguiense]
MSNRQPSRRLGAFFALPASVLLILSLILPLFVATVSMPGVMAEMTTTIYAWGFADDRPKMSDGNLLQELPMHAYPMVLATLMFIVATVIAFVRAGGRSAGLWLTAAAAFVAGMAATVIPQVVSWFAFYSPLMPEQEMGPGDGPALGLGFWALMASAVLAVTSAVLTVKAAPRSETTEVPAPANVDPHGTGGSA